MNSMIKTIEATNNRYTVSDAGIIYKDGVEVPIKHQPNGYCIVPKYAKELYINMIKIGI